MDVYAKKNIKKLKRLKLINKVERFIGKKSEVSNRNLFVSAMM